MGLIDSGRRWFDAQSLPAQIGITGSCVLLLTLGGVAAMAVTPAWPLVIGIAGGALGAGLPAIWLAQRSGKAVNTLADAAHVLRRDDAPLDMELPLLDCTQELRRASVNLRRMVDAARLRERLLEERNAALETRLAARTHELSTLQDLSIGLASKSNLHELVDEALAALGQTMEYASASLWTRSERAAGGHIVLLGYRAGTGHQQASSEDLTGMRLSRANLQRYEQIERERQPLIENRARQGLLSWLWSKVTDDARSSELYRASRSWMAVPLRYREDVLGVMRVDHEEEDHFDAERARLLKAVSSQTALAMRHARLQEQEREVAVMAERNRIARDLHDAVSQTLFAANVLAGTLARSAAREPPPSAATVAAQAESLERLNRGALAEMRLLMFELRPDALQQTPMAELLKHAIEAVVCRGDIEVDSVLAADDALTPDLRIQLYRIAQEALSNVARHSAARHCEVRWEVHGARQVVLRIRDDGAGFDPDLAHPGHFGLENMRSRALEIGARLSLTSAPGQGTLLQVEWEGAKP